MLPGFAPNRPESPPIRTGSEEALVSPESPCLQGFRALAIRVLRSERSQVQILPGALGNYLQKGIFWIDP
jgi:hypothetical protein